MSDVAVRTVTVDEAAAVAAQFDAWVAAIRTSLHADDVSELVQQARMVREVAKIRKMAQTVGVAASRLEAHALRRLAQLGCTESTKYGSALHKSYGRTFASLTDDEFDALLAARDWSTAAAMAKHIRDEENLQREKERVAAGQAWPGESAPYRHRYNAGEARSAAFTILNRIGTDSFTVTEAASRLLDEMDVPEDDLTLRAARELVRESIASSDETRDDDEFPKFVTFRQYSLGDEEEGTWLRIPISHATAAQLIWMAEYRNAQAKELQDAADLLTIKALEAKIAAEEAGIDVDEFKVSWMWRGIPSHAQPGQVRR